MDTPLDLEATSAGSPIRVGIVLPTVQYGSSREGIEIAAATAERLGWHRVWTTDHVLVDRGTGDRYGRVYEAITTLTWVAATHRRIGLATSVIVVPQRNAVVLAKELATLDALSNGRLSVGVGVGWNEIEYENLGEGERFHQRGAFLDETIRMWRRLWSGLQEPFEGRFHQFADFVFEPLPAQGAGMPIWVGGASNGALVRAGTLGNGYHATSTSPAELQARLAIVREAARAAGRPNPVASVRVGVRFDGATAKGAGYAMRGTPAQIVAEVRSFQAAGATELALFFGENDPERLVAVMERFDEEVLGAL